MNPWNAFRLEDNPSIPSMISGEERRYLYWLTSSQWSGRGHVVEIGPWLGGSTYYLARGMAASGLETTGRLHVYDSFVWRQFMADRHPLDIAVGGSFQPVFEDNLRDYRSMLRVNRTMLRDEHVEKDTDAKRLRETFEVRAKALSWPDAQPVEILFVDGAKSWTGYRDLLLTFGPYLIPGRSLLVLQDYKFWGCFWVAAITELLPDCLQVEHVLRQNTVTYRVQSPIADKLAQVVPAWDDLRAADCEPLIFQAADRLASIGDREGAVVVRLTATKMWIHKDEPDAAIRAFRRSEHEWPMTAQDANLTATRVWLETVTGLRFPPTLRSRIRRCVLAPMRVMRDFLRVLRRMLSSKGRGVVSGKNQGRALD